MESVQEGGSTTRPPLFNGSNYAYWKARMRVFLKTIDERVWMTVVQGWTHPTEIVEEKIVPTPQDEWTEAELKSSGWN